MHIEIQENEKESETCGQDRPLGPEYKPPLHTCSFLLSQFLHTPSQPPLLASLLHTLQPAKEKKNKKNLQLLISKHLYFG